MENIVCGVISENGEFTAVLCNMSTGECYFKDPVMGDARLISEVSVDDPVEIDPTDVARCVANGDYGLCIGVIYDGETIIKLISDTEAFRCPAENPMAPSGDIFEIDINADYEEEEE